MANNAFDRDFGYLFPFLDKVTEAAATLSDSAARQELAGLIAGEKTRWARIRELLAGSADAVRSPAPSRRTESAAPMGASSSTAAPPKIAAPAPARSFTVGSLRPRRS